MSGLGELLESRRENGRGQKEWGREAEFIPPIFLERFLNLCILLALLDFFLLFLLMSTHGGWVSLDYM